MRRSIKRLLLWAPVVLAGMVLYWTVALGAAGMSLLTVGTLTGAVIVVNDEADDLDEQPADGVLPGEEAISVRLQEEQSPVRALTPSVVEPAPLDMRR